MHAQEPYMRLSDLAALVGGVVSEVFDDREFWVVAETADIKNYPERGYCFVTLAEREGKEITARMEGVVWSRNYHIISEFERKTGVRFDKNIRLLIRVGVGFHPVYGLKLQLTGIDPGFTLGEMEKERQQVLDRLARENPDHVMLVQGEFVTANKGLVRPLVFRSLALVTAPDSDGRRDFLHELQTNPYGYRYRVDEYCCQMQGKGSDQQILTMLRQVRSVHRDYDAVVIVRGGGGQIDFGPFDTYDLGREVAGFPLPVITGIGHERNVSVTDLMAHLSLKTPTKAAVFLSEHNHSFEEEILAMGSVMMSAASRRFEEERRRLDLTWQQFLHAVSTGLLETERGLSRLESVVRLLDPEKILARGYAIIRKNGNTLADASGIGPGDELEIALKKDLLRVRVQAKTTRHEKGNDLPESF